MAKIIELIYTQKNGGNGTVESPYRMITQLFTKDGELVAENDPCGKHPDSKDPSEAKDWLAFEMFNPKFL